MGFGLIFENRITHSDYGKMDNQGSLIYLGRRVEVINRGGNKFFPVELEQVLARHPAVVLSAAFPVPDARLGYVPGVWAQVNSEETTVDHLRAFMKENVSVMQTLRDSNIRLT